ncbi:MAG: DNA repair protein RecO [Ktedonobacterales bacterium]|nr:DNA repair protein RecO [Ktedonobacterales bacterium]
MAHPRVYSIEAIILRRGNFGEADRILTLFTPTQGKIRAIAKGIRRTTSRKAGHLELFTRAQLLLASGRELEVVTQAEGREQFEHLRLDLWHATGAWYTAELVDRFLEDADPHPRLYALFIATLRRLDAGALAHEQTQSWLALRYFELRLLDELGYRPNLHTCVGCDTPLRPEDAGYSAELGGALCPACAPLAQRRLSLRGLKVLRLLQTSEWEALPRLRLDGTVREEIEALLRMALRFHLDRDLKSWPFLRRVTMESAPPE